MSVDPSLDVGLLPRDAPTRATGKPSKRLLILLPVFFATFAVLALGLSQAEWVTYRPYTTSTGDNVLHKRSDNPECRKAMAIAVDDAELFVVWGGKGPGRDEIYQDLHVYQLNDQLWLDPKQQGASDVGRHGKYKDMPRERWKMYSEYVPQLGGTIMFGGSTRPHLFFNDIWLLKMHQEGGAGSWEEAVLDEEALLNEDDLEDTTNVSASLDRKRHKHRKHSGAIPAGRRAFGGSIVVDEFNFPGKVMMAVSYGKDGRDVLHDDVWMADLSEWPRVSWRELWNGDGATGPAPPARRGHAMVFVPSPSDPLLVVVGGRTTNKGCYFADVWAFHLTSATWEDLTPTSGPQPIGRDHLHAQYISGSIYIHGGRGGKTYDVSVPLGDMWRFNLSARRWTQLKPAGDTPLPRFLGGMTAVQSRSFQPHVAAAKQEVDGIMDSGDAEDNVTVGWGGRAGAASRGSDGLTEGGGGEDVGVEFGFLLFGGETLAAPQRVADGKYTDDITPAKRGGSVGGGENVTDEHSVDDEMIAARNVSVVVESSSDDLSADDGSGGLFAVHYDAEMVDGVDGDDDDGFKGCYLNDLWWYSIESNRWVQLTEPHWCQKRCERMYGQ